MRVNTYKLFRIVPTFKRFFYLYWNRFFLYILGVTYGQNLKITNKVYVRGYGKIIIGDNFLMSSGDNINPISRNILGSLFAPYTNSIIEIGNNVGLSSVCVWANTHIKIGNNVNVGANTLILDNDAHPHQHLARRRGCAKKENIPSAPIAIDDDVWVGAECLILKGVHIGARSIIAAGSVVINDIPKDCIAGGNPCKVIRLLKC